MRVRQCLLGFLSCVLPTVLIVTVMLVLLATSPSPPADPSPPSAPGDIEVRVSEDYLSRFASLMARERYSSIHDMELDVQPENQAQIRVSAQVYIGDRPFLLGVAMDTSLAVQAEGLRLSVDSIRVLGGLDIPVESLPGPLRAIIDDVQVAINSEINQLLLANGLVPVGISTDDRTVTVALRARQG